MQVHRLFRYCKLVPWYVLWYHEPSPQYRKRVPVNGSRSNQSKYTRNRNYCCIFISNLNTSPIFFRNSSHGQLFHPNTLNAMFGAVEEHIKLRLRNPLNVAAAIRQPIASNCCQQFTVCLKGISHLNVFTFQKLAHVLYLSTKKLFKQLMKSELRIWKVVVQPSDRRLHELQHRIKTHRRNGIYRYHPKLVPSLGQRLPSAAMDARTATTLTRLAADTTRFGSKDRRLYEE